MKVCWHLGRSRAHAAVESRYGFDEIAGKDKLISFDEWARYVKKEKTFPECQLTQTCNKPPATIPPYSTIPYTKPKPWTQPFEGPPTYRPGDGIP